MGKALCLSAKTSFEAYARYFIEEVAPLGCKQSTINNYDRCLKLHTYPVIGPKMLSDLEPGDVTAVLAHAAKKVGQKQLKHIHAAIRRVLSEAVTQGKLAENPAKRVKPPRVPRPKVDAWTKKEASRFLQAARGERLYAFFRLALDTGMRRGELLALTWQDVSFEEGWVFVCKNVTQNKTGGHHLESDGKTYDATWQIIVGGPVMDDLRRHRVAVSEELMGKGFGRPWLVFPSEAGGYIPFSSLRRVMVRIQRRAGIKPLSIHGLRHTCATTLINAGVPLPVVAQRLGHSDPSITLKVYAHLLPSLQREAADVMANAFSVR